jgi:hypothetical protein
MTNKFRIIEKIDLNGDLVFTPQYQKFLLWFDFWNVDFPPSVVKFHNFQSAKEFIQKQISKPKNKIHYIN